MSLVRDLLIDHAKDSSMAARARLNRWAVLSGRFPGLASMSVVDLGGEPAAWLRSPVRPRSLVCVNLNESIATEGGIEVIRGDACTIKDIGHFDLVYSNSCIEHVGGHDRCMAFANNVRELGDHYWVQTPYRYFPIEPHYIFPGAQFLPLRLQMLVGEKWSLSFVGATADDGLSIDLLSKTSLAYYFPEAEIWKEKMFGLTKSLVALRD